MSRAHSPSLPSLHLHHSSFSKPSVATNTGSHLITKVKQHWAWLVLGWITAWEHCILLTKLPLSYNQLCAWLLAGWSGLLSQMSVGGPLQTGPGTHTASCKMIAWIFPRVKMAKHWVGHPPSF